jgi:hypothetical protein
MLKKIFSKKQAPQKTENIMKIANRIGPLIDDAVQHVFMTYKMILLSEPITYIVPAVWGAKQDGDLTDIQKEIQGLIGPVIENVLNSFEMKDLSHDQEFALYFLIRGVIISKIIYMIEAFRNRLNERMTEEQNLKETLMHHKPVGRA